MSIIQIPIDNINASFKLRTDIEEVTYVLEFNYNSRLERWHINIMDADEEPILMGVPLGINFNILQRFRMTTLPPGLMMLFDAEEQNSEATRASFGDTSLLLYEEA